MDRLRVNLCKQKNGVYGTCFSYLFFKMCFDYLLSHVRTVKIYFTCFFLDSPILYVCKGMLARDMYSADFNLWPLSYRDKVRIS